LQLKGPSVARKFAGLNAGEAAIVENDVAALSIQFLFMA
jgi:hypothetical protein